MSLRWSITGVLALMLTAVAPVQAARPPLPAGAKQIAPGHLPGKCSAPGDDGYGPNYGYYYSGKAKAWVQGPRCVPVWGNLALMPSTVVRAGSRVTMTAVPDGGSNSGTYAPQTKSISWTFPGKRVSGCGTADLSCTVIPFARAGREWQWGLFHVTMPRTFFVDSPGSNCAGLHLCPGFATNAWSFVGVPPAGTSPPLPPGFAKLCLGACKSASVITPKTLAPGATTLELTATCGGAKASGARASQLGTSTCPVAATTTATKGKLTELEKIQEADAKARADRHQIMKDLQTKIFDLTQDVTTNKAKSADKSFQQFDGYIRANAGSPDVVAALQDADSGLAGTFPPQTATASAALRARAAQAGGPAASAVLHSMSASRPTKADARAYNDALALATSPTASLDRGRARLLLSLAVVVGRRVLLHDLGSRTTFKIAAGSARVPAGRERSLVLKATGRGGRALRILGVTGLSRKVGATLRASSRGRSASRTITVR